MPKNPIIFSLAPTTEIPYIHEVAFTHAFERACVELHLTEDEFDEITEIVSANPEIGDLIQGTGGCRKFRFAGRGKGKSGGYRVVTYYYNLSQPVILVTIFAKGNQANLTQSERNDLGKTVALIKKGYDKKPN